MCVVRNAIRCINHLRLKQRSPIVCLFINTRLLPFEYFVGEIETRNRLMTCLQFFSYRQPITVVRKTTDIIETFIERIFTSVTKWWMTDVMKQRECFNKIFV